MEDADRAGVRAEHRVERPIDFRRFVGTAAAQHGAELAHLPLRRLPVDQPGLDDFSGAALHAPGSLRAAHHAAGAVDGGVERRARRG